MEKLQALVRKNPFEQFLAELFEYEYCAECGGDAQHHTVSLVLGNPFAWCNHPPSAETNWEYHPVIAAYRAEKDSEVSK